MPETIAIASDHAGVDLKETLKDEITRLGFEVNDMGPATAAQSVDYPDFAQTLANWVAKNKSRGVLICGSGIGMSMAANRVKGVRAALCRDTKDAELARQHNDANVLCLGGRITLPAAAVDILKVFLKTPFDGGRHQLRVDKLG